ncbi:hypothetical protein X942_5490 [Burkholderia pseudomallei MSHR5596]|nr:hypothetical protein X942_5490 [Burkholderia pseudomallei MSHR5596]
MAYPIIAPVDELRPAILNRHDEKFVLNQVASLRVANTGASQEQRARCSVAVPVVGSEALHEP